MIVVCCVFWPAFGCSFFSIYFYSHYHHHQLHHLPLTWRRNPLSFNFLFSPSKWCLLPCLLAQAGMQHLQHNNTANYPHLFPGTYLSQRATKSWLKHTTNTQHRRITKFSFSKYTQIKHKFFGRGASGQIAILCSAYHSQQIHNWLFCSLTIFTAFLGICQNVTRMLMC